MPTVLANVFLSLFRDSSHPVRGTDTVCVASPMYNEEKGAGRSLASLLQQERLPDEIAISINGGTDNTYEVVVRTLMTHHYQHEEVEVIPAIGASVERWRHPEKTTVVRIVTYQWQIGKADSLNNLVEHRVVSADRIVVVDGDTVFHPAFIRELHDNFYRLRVQRGREGIKFVIEDYAIQSGVVMSHAPERSSFVQKFISTGREAEYAFGLVLKDGQTRTIGYASGQRNPMARSRLYTVVGCGFAARRDLFPIPWDTKTEDHDLTLASQGLPTIRRSFSRDELSTRGFRVVRDGVEGSLDLLMDKHDRVELLRGGNARLVRGALMKTEDPPHLSGYLGQLERWNGGSQQNALKRLSTKLSANVSYIIWSSLLENLLGIALLAVIPIGLALHIGNPSIGIAPFAVGLGFAIDIIAMTLFVIYGLYRYRRAEGKGKGRALVLSLGRGLFAALPFTVLRYMNPLAYVASATVVLPSYLRARRGTSASLHDSSWRRPSHRQRSRTQAVFLLSLVTVPLSMASSIWLAQELNPINQEAWRLVYGTNERVDMEQFLGRAVRTEPEHLTNEDIRELPYRQVSDQIGELIPAQLAQKASTPLTSGGGRQQDRLSGYCDPSFTPNIPDGIEAGISGKTPAGGIRAWGGDAAAYAPLGRGHLLTLARLTPLAGLIENAGRAYAVPPALLLKVLLNESYLDPLAVGPTGDKGLSQMTSDSLTMLKALARKEGGRYYNSRLFPASFSVYDPDFSICAGAAKLSWAMNQPEVDDPQEAYALYINPIHGLHRGEVSPEHRPLTVHLEALTPMVDNLTSVFAAYQTRPERLTETERELVDIAVSVAEGELSVQEGYHRTFRVVLEAELPDQEMYQAVFRYYDGQYAALP